MSVAAAPHRHARSPRVALPGALTAALVGGLAPACLPDFHCSDDVACDLHAGGRCVVGVCHYGETTDAASTGPTDTVTGTGPDTGGPTVCEPFDVVLADVGKATDLALAADGGVFIVGVTSNAPAHVRVARLGPDGVVAWRRDLADTDNKNVEDDTDLWARVFLPAPAGDELRVVYTRRELDANSVPQKHAPYLQRVATVDGAPLALHDELAATYRSLRAVAMPNPDELLLAGELQDNLWYQRATSDGASWTPAWPNKPVSFDPEAKYKDPVITQALVALPAPVVGGTWNVEVDSAEFRAWLRQLAAVDGATQCECTWDDAGILAIAPTRDGGLFLAGFTVDLTHSRLWLSKTATACTAPCPTLWSVDDPGAVDDPVQPRARPELFHDAAFALTTLASGAALVAGARDGAPWAAAYTDAGELTWQMDPSPGVPRGAVLAMSISADDACLTLVGSTNYQTADQRRWWVRRVALP